jgi:prepilin-type N-terminal cleavage/methylation domain-containing protein
MSRSRFGYTLTEMLAVLVIFGVVTSLSIPRMHGISSRAGVSSARLQTAIYQTQAREAALQRGREARFVRTGNILKVTIDSAGTQVLLVPAHNLQSEHKVTVTSSRDTIKFDPRGFAIGTNAIEKFVTVRDGLRDSVCVTKMGKVIQRGCAL